MMTIQTEVLFGQIAAKKNFWFGITIKNQGKFMFRKNRLDWSIVNLNQLYLGVIIDYKWVTNKFNMTKRITA